MTAGDRARLTALVTEWRAELHRLSKINVEEHWPHTIPSMLAYMWIEQLAAVLGEGHETNDQEHTKNDARTGETALTPESQLPRQPPE